MPFDAHKNLAYSTVATAPSPASSGTSLVVAAGEGTRFPAVSFNALIWPTGVNPTPANAEIVRVTNISTDTFTITRTQESTSARTVVVGDQIAAVMSVKTFTDIEAFFTENADGMQVQGGSTPRTLKWTGANITLTGSGTAVHTMPAATDNIMGESNNVAAQSDQETGTSLTKFVSPGRQQFHPSAAKCWVQGTPNSTTIITSYNITSLGDTATGQQTVTIATDFSSASYCVQVTVGDTSTTLAKSATVMTKAAGSYIMNSVVEAGSGSDPASDWNSVGFGDQ